MTHPLVEAVTPKNATKVPWLITVPLGNDTEALHGVIAHAWVSSPNIRGTMDIIQSCILTLIACIYTALHLNVAANSAWYSISWIKFYWVLLALFAPEIVVFMAFEQLRQAWRLKKTLCTLQRNSPTAPKNHDFDLTYCFFVVMGGIRVDVDDILSVEDLSASRSEPFLQMHPRSARLSAEGVIKLAQRGHWIKISRERIADKSKANFIQKALVFIQVSWMVGQCIARKFHHLPLTILEVHTMVHVVCAIFLYMCWFRKPLDVQDPEVLESKEFKGEIAAMVQGHFYSEWNTKLAIVSPQSFSNMNHPGIKWKVPDPDSVLLHGQVLTSGLAYYGNDIYGGAKVLTLTPKFLKRWECIFQTFDFDERIAQAENDAYLHPVEESNNADQSAGYQKLRDDNSNALYLYRLEEFMSENEPFKTDRENFNAEKFGWSYAISLFLLPGMYGGVHLTAWAWGFPTLLESLMWKISCIIIASGFPTALLIWGALYTMRMRNEPILWFLAFLGAIVYLAARLYIIVESFLSLRHVPVGVYVSLEWFELFPHF